MKPLKAYRGCHDFLRFANENDYKGCKEYGYDNESFIFVIEDNWVIQAFPVNSDIFKTMVKNEIIEIVDFRRCRKGEHFWYIDTDFEVAEMEEDYSNCTDKLFEAGNYFLNHHVATEVTISINRKLFELKK